MSISGLIAGGGIPVGDQGRVETINAPSGVITTIFTESSGSGGIITDVYVQSNSASVYIDLSRVTIDGASERTYNYVNPTTAAVLNLQSSTLTRLPLPLIDYETSATIKILPRNNYVTAHIVYNLKT